VCRARWEPGRGLLLDSAAVDLDLETIERGEHSILAVRGEIDVYTAPLLRQAILDLVEQGRLNVVIDMHAVDFLDSTGLGVLVEGLKRVRTREGSFAIVATEGKILKIFDITGLNKAFPIHASVEEALGEARAAAGAAES
jgi:anti-sigma B factor antagonist